MDSEKSVIQTAELMSALVDGELKNSDLTQTLDFCARDPQGLRQWNAYCMIGDVLRSPDLARIDDGQLFLSKLRDRLVLASGTTRFANSWTWASNDANFGWRLAVGFASLATVAVISWTSLAGLSGSEVGSVQLAQATRAMQQVFVSSGQGTMLRDAKLEELLAAHKQLGGGSMLQISPDFLSHAVFSARENATQSRP